MGVVDAFHGLGTAGSATLHAVAPGIARRSSPRPPACLWPCRRVVAYNQFSARIRVFASAIDDFCRELLNSLEEIPARAQRAPGELRSAGGGRWPSPRITAKPARSLAEINITPLVDVVLVLLVIFMITEPVLQSGIEVNVPKTRTVKQITEQRMVVTIDRDQQIFLNDQPINIHELAAEAAPERRRSRRTR